MNSKSRVGRGGVPTRVGMALVATGLWCSPSWAQTLRSLGRLSGHTVSGANGVSGDGTIVVGYSGTGFSSMSAVRWTAAGGLQSVGTLGGQVARALAVSADGSTIVGYSQAALPSGPDLAFRWTAGAGVQPLGTLGGDRSLAYCVSADGSVIGGASYSSSTRTGAFRWTAAEGMQDLGLPGNYSATSGMSGDGSVLVGGGSFAFRWTAGGTLNLGLLNSQGAGASACNADGNVITGVNGVSNAQGMLDTQHVFRWTPGGGMVDLGAINTTIASSTAMTRDGSTIVGMSGSRAFLWRPEHGMINLDMYLGSVGVDISGWQLRNATGISADGGTIVGQGYRNGSEEGWIATIQATGTCCDASGACSSGLPPQCAGAWSRGGACTPTACPLGACCQGTGCAVSLERTCAASDFRGAGSSCGGAGNPTSCCFANYDQMGGVGVTDIFAFLSAWFIGDPRTDVDGSAGLQVGDVFRFLTIWFAGC